MRRISFGWTLLFIAAMIGGGIGAFFLSARKTSIAREEEPLAGVEKNLLSKGAELAAIGNCNVCHTKSDGQAYAGGRPIATPFGRVYSSNITPEPQTGIGGWPQAAFIRAMREGVSRDGRHLYPAFPYDHMAKMRADDIKAVYVFIMTRQPIRATSPPNELTFPFSLRTLVAAWKLLFLDRGVLENDPSKTALFNRGAYLVEGLGHCGACHTPRNALGAERRDQPYAGGEADGWTAPALNRAQPAAVPWTADRLYAYLRHGSEALHGTVAGPMAPVVHNLSTVPQEEVRAIAMYVAAMAANPDAMRLAEANRAMARARGEERKAAERDEPEAGAAVYAGACAQCHGENARFPAVPALNLSLSSALRLPRPDNSLRIVRGGIQPDGGAGPMMPGFANALSDDQMVDLLGYLRGHFTDKPLWSGLKEAVRNANAEPSRIEKATQETTSQ